MPRYENDGRVTWTRIVYVIELSPEACASPRSPCGGRNCGRTPVYVGQTAKAAEDRLQEHLRGHKSSMWVRRHGLHLRPDLSAGYDEMIAVEESEHAERELAAALRADGRFCVYGGH